MYFYCNMLEEEGSKILQICIIGTMISRCTIDILTAKATLSLIYNPCQIGRIWQF